VTSVRRGASGSTTRQLNAFFEQLRKHRKQEAGAGGGPGPIEDPQENEAARLLIAE
jgi:hypothetical protein